MQYYNNNTYHSALDPVTAIRAHRGREAVYYKAERYTRANFQLRSYVEILLRYAYLFIYAHPRVKHTQARAHMERYAYHFYIIFCFMVEESRDLQFASSLQAPRGFFATQSTDTI